MAGSPLSIGTNKTTVFNEDKTDFKIVTTYDVYNDKTGQTQTFNTYAEAAAYTNSNGGSAMDTAELQKTVQQSGGAVNAVYLDGKQVDLQTGKVQDEVLLDQNQANAKGKDPATVPAPVDNEFGNLDQAIAEQAKTKPEPVLTDEQAQVELEKQIDKNNAENPYPVQSDTEIQQQVQDQVAGQGYFGTPYDDEGNLNPGWSLREDGTPVYVGSNTSDGKFFIEPATQASADASREKARQQQTISQQRKQVNNGDWRVRLRLAPQSQNLYRAAQPGILAPLAATDGIIFPYTPSINTVYRANYSQYDLTHNNYRGYFYSGSAVDPVSLSAIFTAQDTTEANYLLAVIHFFRSVTKMFYGQDTTERGSPPPLVYLTGLGEYQFNEHSCLVSSFAYNLPADVDYIRSGSPNQIGTDLTTRRARQQTPNNGIAGTVNRLASAFLTKGAVTAPPAPATLGLNRPTYVPTKIEIQLTLLPVQSRQQVSKQFSLQKFANGDLLKGGFW